MILTGNALHILPLISSESVDCVVTSPPYWRLRDYGVAGQLGLEATPALYVESLLAVLTEMKRVLKPQGTLRLNLGDSYARTTGTGAGGNRALMHMEGTQTRMTKIPIGSGLKAKDLCGIPWRVAFALQADGWYLRQDIIWHKPNPMPESNASESRCTKGHEYLFLLSKSSKYYFDYRAIEEPAVTALEAKWSSDSSIHSGSRKTGKSTRRFVSGNKERKQRPSADLLDGGHQAGSVPWENKITRRKRSVWTVATNPFPGHFATFPPKLIEPCILAGCPRGGTVLDPFFGAGTTGLVASQHGRKYIGIELNPEYAALAGKRIGL